MSLPAHLSHYGEIDDSDLLAKALIGVCEFDTSCPLVYKLHKRAMIGGWQNSILLRSMTLDDSSKAE